MRPTAYEFQRKGFGSRWAEAVALDAEKGAAAAIKDMVREMLNGKSKPPDELFAALPFALATRVVRSFPDPTWKDFATHPDVMDFSEIESMIGQTAYQSDLVADWAAASVLNLWHFAMHERAGLRVYEVAAGLGQKLHHTEVRGLSTDDLRLPYQSIYIVMPPPSEGRTNLKLQNELTGAHDIGGVYVAETRHDGVRVWKMMFWGPPNENSKNEYDDALFHFTVTLPEGVDLADALDLNENETALSAASSHSAQFYKEFWRPLFKLVMNCVVYMTWPDADARQVENSQYTKLHEKLKKHPKGSNKYERARQELREVLPQRRILLGASVRDLPSDDSAPGSPLTVRTLVSGHWQRFAHGPGRAERRWGWREPFWRGPADAPESNPRRMLGVREVGNDP